MKKKCCLFILLLLFNVSPVLAEKVLFNRPCETSNCEYHGDSFYRINNNLVYKGDEITDGVYVRNYSTLSSMENLVNSGGDYSYSYRDGSVDNHLLLRSKYSSSAPDGTNICNSSFCDNLPLADDKKLSLDFNLHITSNYSDVRVMIDYLSNNYKGLVDVNVLDYNSLSIYVYDSDGTKYGPFMIYDSKYLGLLQRQISGSEGSKIYEDNWKLVSDNIFSNTGLKNKCNGNCYLRISIIPFDTYHNVNSFFNLKSISVEGYDGSYKKDSIQTETKSTDLRLLIVNRMFGNATYKYSPTHNFSLTGNDSEDVLGTVVSEYKADKTYYGVPYGAHKITSSNEFNSRLDGNSFDSSFDVNGYSCSTSVLDSVFTYLPLETDLDWSGKYFYSSDTKIVDCKSGSNCTEIDKRNITGKTAAEIRNMISEQDMYLRYANAKYGDVLVHKEVCNNIQVCGQSGHTRLITETPVVVYDSNGHIDGNNSYIYVTEISSSGLDNPVTSDYVASFLDFTKPNIKNFISSNNVDITNYVGNYTQWKLSKKYTFDSLYNGEKLNSTTRLEQVYVPFTYNLYDGNNIEKPYIQFIYKNSNVMNYGGGIVELETSILENKKLVGTIHSNYKITQLDFVIKDDKGTYKETVYPTYYANNGENTVSFNYEDEMFKKINNRLASAGEVYSVKLDAVVGNRNISLVDYDTETDSPDTGYFVIGTLIILLIVFVIINLFNKKAIFKI